MKKNYFIPLGNKKEFLYIIALSGGPDSTFLLYKMHKLGYRIVAVHLNYRKRHGSFCDERLVIEHCRKLSVRLFIERPDYYRKGNFQAVARELRYNFFMQIAKKFSDEGFKIGGIVIAHNFEDLLETYQLQKERKSLVTYWGLPVYSWFSGWRIFRPLICFEKESIIKFLRQKVIKYAIDHTNDSEIYRRNVIRKRVFALPRKEKDFLSMQIREENILLKQDIKEANRKIRMLFSENVLSIKNKEWLLSKDLIKKRIVYALLNALSENKFFSPKKRIVTEICKQLQSRRDFTVKIGNGLMITKLKEIAIFQKQGAREVKCCVKRISER